jgi:hypothetical protein
MTQFIARNSMSVMSSGYARIGGATWHSHLTRCNLVWPGRNKRMEHIWLAPEIGRWVLPESSRTFREGVGYEVQGKQLPLELLSWT